MRALLVDGNNVVAMQTHAHRHLTAGGELTGGIYGTLRKLHQVLRDHPCDDVVFVRDSGRPAYRDELTGGAYKANRRREGDAEGEAFGKAIGQQLNNLWSLLPFLGITCVRMTGWESDDTIAWFANTKEYESLILSGDQDFRQLVKQDVNVLRPDGNFWRPDPQYLLVRCLTGDSSDNIPGVGGIGTVRAEQIVYSTQATTPEELLNVYRGKYWYSHLSKPDVRQRLLNNWKVMSLEYAVQQMELGDGPNMDVASAKPSREKFSNLCRAYGFRSILDTLDDFLGPFNPLMVSKD